MFEDKPRRCAACGSERIHDNVACLDCGARCHEICGRDRSEHNEPDPETDEHVRRFDGDIIPSAGDVRLNSQVTWRSDMGNSDNRVSDVAPGASSDGEATLTVDPDDYIPGILQRWQKTTIAKLPGGYRPREPLKVEWHQVTGGAVVRWGALNMWAAGVNGADAIGRLQDRIVELCQDFDSGRKPPSEQWLRDRRQMRAHVRPTWNLSRHPRENEPKRDQPSEWLDHEVTTWGNERVEVHKSFTVRSRCAPRGGTRVGEAAWVAAYIFVEAGDEQTALDKLMRVIERAFLQQRAPRDNTTAEMLGVLNQHLRRGPCELADGAPPPTPQPVATGKVACEPEVAFKTDACFVRGEDGSQPPRDPSDDQEELRVLRTALPLVTAARKLYAKQESVMAAISKMGLHADGRALVMGVLSAYEQTHAQVRQASVLLEREPAIVPPSGLATWECTAVRDKFPGRGWKLVEPLAVRTRQSGSGVLIHWPPLDLWTIGVSEEHAAAKLCNRIDELVRLHEQPSGLTKVTPVGLAATLYHYVSEM